MKLKYEIVEKIASIPGANGWDLEVNIISWNDKPAKYDIRRWKREDGEEQMSKLFLHTRGVILILSISKLPPSTLSVAVCCVVFISCAVYSLPIALKSAVGRVETRLYT